MISTGAPDPLEINHYMFGLLDLRRRRSCLSKLPQSGPLAVVLEDGNVPYCNQEGIYITLQTKE